MSILRGKTQKDCAFDLQKGCVFSGEKEKTEPQGVCGSGRKISFFQVRAFCAEDSVSECAIPLPPTAHT